MIFLVSAATGAVEQMEDKPMKAAHETDRIHLATTLFDAFAAGDLDRWEARLAPDFTFDYPGLPNGRGAAAARAFNEPFLAACSDWRTEVHHAATEGDWVLIQMTVTATQSGDLVSPEGTLPASGRRGSVKAAMVVEIRDDGLIHHEATYWNVPDLVKQLAPAG